MIYKKIQPIQIDFSEFQFDKRLGIFMTNVWNTNESNSITYSTYDSIGTTKPIQNFQTTETKVNIVLEWEGINSIWDGKLVINDVAIETSDSNAIFKELDNSRRFRCTYKLDITGLTEIKFTILDLHNKIQTTNTVFITEYVAPKIINFRYLYGTLDSNVVNQLGRYPYNSIDTLDPNTGSIIPTAFEQTYLKLNDYIKFSVQFSTNVEQVKIIDTNHVFSETGEITYDISPTLIFEEYLQVIYENNISNVDIIIQGKDYNTGNWSAPVSTNVNDYNLDMETIINVNNDLPSGESTYVGASALDNNDSCNIFYNLANNSYWQFNDISKYNTDFSNIFITNIIALNNNLELIINTNIILYDLNKQFNMPLINKLNGVINTVTTNIPIAAENLIVTWNNILLPSSISGFTNTLIATFNQNIDETKPINITNLSPANINISNYRYLNNNKITIDAQIFDSNKGSLEFTLSNVYNLANRIGNFNASFLMRGFKERTLNGTVGNNLIYLGINIIDEVGFNTILINNNSIMNYKIWDNGNVLTTDAMAKTTGLSTNDQYAYTYNQSTKNIVLSQYIMNYLLNNAPIITISKT